MAFEILGEHGINAVAVDVLPPWTAGTLS
jgi:hypothetical protein